ncbi:MAG: NAD(P)/FAD-dependent oxidoreductase [Rubrivivax sp.]|nr:NAD(P)/FAD-dependent oxidoreductase [Rubrivivax sp.]
MKPSDAPEAGHCDVLVVGGGPAGSTIATLLAREGRHVVMLEKARHPRFHVGESLLPASGPLFYQLGVREEVERIGMTKWGAEFVSPAHSHSSIVEFAEAWDKSMPYAWQVRRSVLDEILFRNAEKNGAQTLEGWQVRAVDFDADGAEVRATGPGGAQRRWRAKYVVDASGRDTFIDNKLGTKRKNPKHNSAALFGHFRGARRLEGKLEGHITIFWFEHGWFWFIPLSDGTTSIGAVCWPYYLKSRDQPLKEFFLATIAQCPRLAERLADAELVDDAVHATGNYSYLGTHAAGERHVLLGDAYAFIDPVFSSGVHLAMVSAFEGARLVATTLDHPAQAAAARRRYEAVLRKGPREFSWFIYRMTNPALRELFMYPANPLRVKEALMSLLAGDIFGDTPIWRSLAVLKGIYYLGAMASWRRAWAAWRMRRRSIRDLGAVPGENVVVES